MNSDLNCLKIEFESSANLINGLTEGLLTKKNFTMHRTAWTHVSDLSTSKNRMTASGGVPLSVLFKVQTIKCMDIVQIKTDDLIDGN